MTLRITMGILLIAAVCAATMLVVEDAAAVQVFGIQPATNQIVRVDPATGQTFAGFTPPGGALEPNQEFGGLTSAERGAVLLYQNPVANPTDLFRLNPNTGALLSTEFMPAASSQSEFRAGLSFQSGAGVAGADAIFAVNDGEPIQRQDGYGNPVLVDHVFELIQFAGALGGDDQGRQFVVTIDILDDDPVAPVFAVEIVEFDPWQAGVVLNVMPLPEEFGLSPVAGLAFDGNWLYLSDLAGELYTIHPDTGDIVHAVTVQGGPLIGLAARIPEPSSVALAATCALLFCCAAGGRVSRGKSV